MAKMVKFYKGDMIEYEIYKLVDFYDPILRQPTIPVSLKTLDDFERAKYIAFSMAETLTHYQGLGLSANQVGLKDRVCAINMGTEIWTMFNPEIISRSDEPSSYQEGCLSYPGLYLKIQRPETIKVKFQAVGGQWVEETFSGLTSVCIQHEIDHLDGVMYTDKVSSIKLEQAKRKVKANLKKMKIAAQQHAIEQAIEKEKQELAQKTQKQKTVPLAAKEPTIKILDPIDNKNTPKTTDKFVYKVTPA